MRNEIGKLLVGSTLVVFALAGGCGEDQSATTTGREQQPTTATGSEQQSTTATGRESEAQSQNSLEARVDKYGEKIMASSAKAEARQWMKQPSHIFFEANPKEVAQFVEEFYRAGATQVFIADIEEHEGKQFGEGLLIVLPKDTAGARNCSKLVPAPTPRSRTTPSQTRARSISITRLIEPRGKKGDTSD